MEQKHAKIFSIVGIGTVLSLAYSALSYSIQIILVELFGYQLRGVFEILMSMLGLAAVLFSFNLYTALNLHVSRHGAAPTNLPGIGTIVVAIQLAAIAVMYVIAPKDGIVADDLQVWFLGLLLLAGLLNHKVSEFTAILNGNHHFLRAKVLSLVGAIAGALMVGMAYALGHTDVQLIVWLAVLGPFAGSYLYTRLLGRTITELAARKGVLEMRSLYTENGSVYFISLAQFAALKMYLLFIAQSESIDILGKFSLAYSITQFILLPATLLATIIISNRSDTLLGFLRPLKVLIGYGLLSCLGVRLLIGAGVQNLLPLDSLKDPQFGVILGVMVCSIPFSILNILTVSIAIKKNMCTKLFVAGQILMIPALFVCYSILTLKPFSTSPVTDAYVLASAVSSLFSLAALYARIREKSCLS